MTADTQLSSSVKRFLQSLSARNASPHTITAYRTDLSQFVSFLTATDVTVTCPIAITRSHILDYLSHLSGMGRSGVTRARKLAALREYCQFLVDEGTLPSSPTEKITRPKGERKQRVFLRVDEYMRLLNASAGNVVNALRSEQLLPSHMSTCPQW